MSPRIHRSAALARAAASALVLAALAGCRPPAGRLVVVVDVDTLRADALSCYGNPRPTSPHFDAFAATGTRFAWAFSQAPYTLPSQASIVTGLYPESHGVLDRGQRLAGRAVTLAERFRAAGWRTAAFVDGGYVSEHYGFDQGFETFAGFRSRGVAASERPISDWLAEARGEDRFLFIHTYDPHTPYAPPEPFRSRFAAYVEAPTPGFEPTTHVLEKIRASQWEGPPRQLAPRDLAYARALYDGDVAFVDSWFGRLLARLDELGLSERAVIAVISDHGEEFQEHGSVLHEKLYATVTRVPWLIRAPGGAKGLVVEETVETIDLAPTLLELAGLPVPAGLDGRSLAAAVRGEGAPTPRPAIGHSPLWGEQQMLVDEIHHLIVTVGSGQVELYRVREDPAESRELSAVEADTAARLRRELDERRAGIRRRPGLVEPVGELPVDADASLRALGYLR